MRTKVLLPLLGAGLVACGPTNGGVPGPTDVIDVPMTGTIFVIVFENHGQGSVLTPENTYLTSLAEQYATADAYLANSHPSLSNYLLMTSADTHGIGDDGPPAQHAIDGTDHLAAQLDEAGVPWRAYMEGMGEPCLLDDRGLYAVKHNPFAYYTSVTTDHAACADHIVDFDASFAADLASDTYRFMWITPDLCNDMHDCPTTTSDEWLARVIPEIMASPGYQAGGAIFLLWDEGSTDVSYAASYVFGRPQNIPFVLISENLATPAGFVSQTTYTHDSWLATIEDVLGLPRLPSTVDSTPMGDFFGAPGYWVEPDPLEDAAP